MRTLFILCRKDFTHGWPWVVGTITLTGAAILSSLTDRPLMLEAAMLASRWVPAAILFLATTAIMRNDPFSGSDGFIRTRPLSPSVVLGGKLVFILLFLLLPIVFIHCVYLVILGVRMTALDWLVFATEKFLIHMLVAAWAVPCSMITRQTGTMSVAVTIGGLLGFGLFTWLQPAWNTAIPDTEHHTRLASFSFYFQIVLVVSSVAASLVWAASRRPWLSLSPIVLGSVLLFVSAKVGPFDFVEFLSRDTKITGVFDGDPEFQLASVHPEVLHSTIGGVTRTKWILPGRVAGLKSGWTALPVKIRATAESPDGSVMNVQGKRIVERSDRLPYPLRLILGAEEVVQVNGQPVPGYDRSMVFDWEGEGRFPAEADISGTVTFRLHRDIILAELPLEVGAKAAGGRFSYEIAGMSASPGIPEVSFVIIIRGAALAGRGEATRRISPGQKCLILANPVTGEHVWLSEPFPFFIHQDIEIYHLTFPDRHVKVETTKGKFSGLEAFLKDARLYAIGYEYAGTIDLPYQIKGMKLYQE